jgi:hypothetical protein
LIICPENQKSKKNFGTKSFNEFLEIDISSPLFRRQKGPKNCIKKRLYHERKPNQKVQFSAD